MTAPIPPQKRKPYIDPMNDAIRVQIARRIPQQADATRAPSGLTEHLEKEADRKKGVLAGEAPPSFRLETTDDKVRAARNEAAYGRFTTKRHSPEPTRGVPEVVNCQACYPWWAPLSVPARQTVEGAIVPMAFESWLLYHLHVVIHQKLAPIPGEC